MRNIFQTERPTNFKLAKQTEHEDLYYPSAMTSKVKDQGRKVMWSV